MCIHLLVVNFVCRKEKNGKCQRKCLEFSWRTKDIFIRPRTMIFVSRSHFLIFGRFHSIFENDEILKIFFCYIFFRLFAPMALINPRERSRFTRDRKINCNRNKSQSQLAHTQNSIRIPCRNENLVWIKWRRQNWERYGVNLGQRRRIICH